MPTIAGICEIPYTNKTMGNDILKTAMTLLFWLTKNESIELWSNKQ